MFLLRQRSSASAARRPVAGGAWSLGSGAALTTHQHFPAALRVDEVTSRCAAAHTHAHTEVHAGKADPSTFSPQDPAYASFLLEELQHLQWPGGGDHHQMLDVRCPICGASFHQLRRRALRQALGVNRKVAPSVDQRTSRALAGGAEVKGQVTVTPLTCENPLEGLWRVTAVSREQT